MKMKQESCASIVTIFSPLPLWSPNIYFSFLHTSLISPITVDWFEESMGRINWKEHCKIDLKFLIFCLKFKAMSTFVLYLGSLFTVFLMLWFFLPLTNIPKGSGLIQIQKRAISWQLKLSEAIIVVHGQEFATWVHDIG